VKPPRVSAAPAALECRYVKTIEIPDEEGKPIPHAIILGRVVGIYIDDRILSEGRVQLAGLGVLSRLGYTEYGVLERIFSMPRPADPKASQGPAPAGGSGGSAGNR
jgi:flavin reductase (DIM6/NTAB) family NADH-FMN oxidoreductase RutF